MKEGEPVNIPTFPPLIGADGKFDPKALAARDEWLERYAKEHEVMAHPWADGRAYYEVRGNTLHHIAIGDAWTLPGYIIRGLRRRDVERMLVGRGLFGRRKHEG